MIHALGAIDPANAMIGWAMAALDRPLLALQSAERTLSHRCRVEHGEGVWRDADYVRHLESLIDLHTGVLPELKHFILPGR